VVPNLYFSTTTMLPMEYSPPFTEIMWVSFRSFFGDLLYSFCLTVVAAYAWEYAKHIKREQLMQERLQARLARAELHALKMQLQPHFLFNTLHTISNLASVDSTKAQRMIARLSELLRLSLDHVTSEAVPVRRELDFLKTYLDIEQTRFEERLRVTIDFDEEVLDAELPNMLLQPLVENAIKHGVEPREEGGRVIVTARRQGDSLALEVRDNGDGLMGAIREGTGVRNTRERLHHLYGPGRQQFTLAAGADGGTLAAVVIPFDTDDGPATPFTVPASIAEPSHDSGVRRAGPAAATSTPVVAPAAFRRSAS
jgi:LytS/YehU family sensor histidine kinase